MKKVEIYDQYKAIYNNDTLVHPSSGFTVTVQDGLTENEAISIVLDKWEESKTIGSSYYDKLVNETTGYAELVINFPDGKVLTRVISIVE